MSTNDLLETLKAELNFIEKGGYGNPAGKPWVRSSIFLDSPICLNLGDPGRRYPCSECLLIDFVPAQDRPEAVPCHHIPLSDAGETVDSLEWRGNEQRLEEKVKSWLRHTISKLQTERTLQ